MQQEVSENVSQLLKISILTTEDLVLAFSTSSLTEHSRSAFSFTDGEYHSQLQPQNLI